MVHWRSLTLWKTVVEVQLIWTVCSDEMVRGVVSAGIRKERKKNVTTLLDMYSHCVDVLDDLVREMLNQGCAQTFRNFHPFSSRSVYIAGEYTFLQKRYDKKGNFICERRALQDTVQRVFS